MPQAWLTEGWLRQGLDITSSFATMGELTVQNETEEFFERLQKWPAVLFLGQEYLALESGSDDFLAELARKFGTVSDRNVTSYGQILGAKAFDSPQGIESSLTWMEQRGDRLSTPEWLDIVASFPWSTLYSSAIDSMWPKTFRVNWREMQHIYEEKFKPLNPRNRLKLHCTYLFGCVNRRHETERPPLSRRELSKRKQVAVALARRLPEIITPFGILVIEGYRGEGDWFPLEDLLSILDGLGERQTHLFSVDEQLANNSDVVDLVEAKKLVLHKESLAERLLTGKNEGKLKLGEPPEQRPESRRIRIADRILDVPQDIWNEVSTFATILDDSTTSTASLLSNRENKYDEFRSFLSETSTNAVWSGYDRGFAFKRDFEGALATKVDEKLRGRDPQLKPVVVHGQTGTGKTIALQSLAYRVRREGKHPVLFIGRRSQKPNNARIDDFCEWVEREGAAPTLIVWDGMLEIEQYYQSLQYLASKGRRAVLVGSFYRSDIDGSKKVDLVSAPAELAEKETDSFRSYLNEIDPNIVSTYKDQISKRDAIFLVALYRLLPDTRGELGRGVDTEVGKTEEELHRLVHTSTVEARFTTALGAALLKASLIDPQHSFVTELREVAGEQLTDVQALIGLVMVPGRFGLFVPIELLLRAVGRRDIVKFAELLKKFDVFRWSDDPSGNISIGPRNSLEAQLLVKARLGDAASEVAYGRQLLLAVKDSEGRDNPEIQFAVDLIRSMGPNGQDSDYFESQFVSISNTLKELREDFSVQNPRLMLQEASLMREAVKRSSMAGEPLVDTDELLDRAEQVLRDALQQLVHEWGVRQTRSKILVELASLLGTRVLHMLRKSEPVREILQVYNDAKKTLLEARAADPDNYYQIDVWAWIVIALFESDIKNSILDAPSRAEIEADILHAFEMGENEDYGPQQQELFYAKQETIGYVLNKQEMSDDAFAALQSRGSAAGYYLRALRIAGDLRRRSELNSTETENCQRATEYLTEHYQYIENDGRCLYLLLRLWWMTSTGRAMFSTFREAVPFDHDQWQQCLKYVEKLMSLGEAYSKPAVKYLKGLAAYHLGLYETAKQVFGELNREVQNQKRLNLSYVYSTPQGEPKPFDGIVKKIYKGSHKGVVDVLKLRQDIPFYPDDFKADLQERESLNNFYIGFNFIGPLAYPRRHNSPPHKAGRS